MKKKMNILEEANKLVYGDRQNAYAHPKINFARAAQIAGVLNKKEYTAEEIANIQFALKWSRQEHKHKRDNLVDMAGYIEVKARIIGEDE